MVGSPVVMLIGLGMGADTGQWWLALAGAAGTCWLIYQFVEAEWLNIAGWVLAAAAAIVGIAANS